MKRVLAILTLGAILATGFFLSEKISKFDVISPAPRTPVLEPLAESISSITVPVSVSMTAVGEALELGTPKREADSRKISLARPFAQSELSWDLERSDLKVSGRGGELTIASELSGEVYATGAIDIIRKFDFNVRSDMLASISITGKPVLTENWRVSQDLSEIKIDIQKANIPIKQFGTINLKNQMFPALENVIAKLRAQLGQSLAQNDFLKRAAKKGWKRFCASTPLGENSGIWLETKPFAARATQVRINSKDIHFTIGVDVKNRILSEKTSPKCPFPKNLIIEEPGRNIFRIVIPAQVDYETIEKMLSEEIVGKSFGENVSLVIKAVRIRPHGKLFMLETDVELGTDLLYGRSIRGTLYVLAEPRLDTETQTVVLENLKLETDSQNMLFSIAGEAAEPLLLKAVSSRLPFNLKTKLEELENRTEATLSALSSENVSVSGKVDRIRLTSLDIGPKYLRVVLEAEGRVSAAVSGVL